jgi:hypothetical protein
MSACLHQVSFYQQCRRTLDASAGTHHGDFDIGEQFHNYILHQEEQQFCGVEIPLELVQKLQAEGLEIAHAMRWERLIFGWQISPYFALRMLARAIELAKGAPRDSTSAFSWQLVVLNLPGGPGYNPCLLRVQKITATGDLATELVIYFDDGRVSGATYEATKLETRQVTSRCQFYGNQDASRKRSDISQRPHAWAGGVAFTDLGICRKTVTQAKWDK